jgi:hypothetical protein
VDLAAVMAGRMVRFPGVAVTTGWHGLDGDDGRADDVVPRLGGDGDGGGGSRGCGDVVPMVEEECDGAVPRHGGEGQAYDMVPGHSDGVEAARVVVAWTRRRRRGRGKFWQPDGVQVNILRLGFKDRADRCFIGEQQ